MHKRHFFRTLATLVVFLAVVGGGVFALAGASLHVVHLIINYGDGAEKRLDAIPWTKGMTVEDLLNLAKSSTHGISFDAKGTGSAFFLQRIDDLTNEGGGTTKKNWQYWLNTTYGNIGAGSQQLEPDDVVTWKFDTYPPSTNGSASLRTP